ncbi:MAG: SPASM domain-containing protein [Fibrobacteres bacterium]|nr:SPASM domain-containing protein [Fibrobacterota bacterium]
MGRTSIVIDPYGNVYPCLIVRIGDNSIKKASLSEIHAKGFQEIFNMKRTVIKCDSCEDRNTCTFCEGILYLYNGNKASLRQYCKIIENVRTVKE